MKIIRPSIPKTVCLWLWGGLAWRTGVAWLLPVGFDEVYYYLYSRHLNWSYFDHPPVVAITTGLGWWLTDTIVPLTVRFGALGLHTLSLLLLYLLAERLFDRKVGILAIAIASITPLFWIAFGILTSPDNGLIFFWTLTLLIAAYEFIPSAAGPISGPVSSYQPSYRIALLGLTLGLACLSKYHGFILGLGLVGFCLTSDRARKALWSPWTALSLLIFGLTLTPLWFWNSQYEWISFRFHLGMRFEGGEPSAYRPLDVLGAWLLGIVYLFPAIGLPLWCMTGKALWQQLQAGLRPLAMKSDWIQETGRIARDRTAFILWVSLPIALGFTLLGGKQAIYPAWPAPGFWGLSLLLAHAASQWRPRTIKRWLLSSGLILGALATVALLHVSLGLLQKPGIYSLFGGLVPHEQDGSTALIDTVQLRSRATESAEFSQALQSVDFVFTDEFYLSAYIDMAFHPLTPLPITCFSQDPRGFVFWHEPTQWIDKDALYLTLASLHRDRATLLAEFQPFFQTLEPLVEIPLTRGGTVTETILVYRAIDMERPYQYPY